MRKIDPADFAAKKAEMDKVLHGLVKKRGTDAEKSEFEWALDHMARKLAGEIKESYKFDRYSKDPVKDGLNEIFHGKCAYCESYFSKTQPVDVEHFRPKNEVKFADGHGGYWWLAMEWDNLLPSCIDCNRVRGHAFDFDEGVDTQLLSTLISRKYKQSNSGKGNFFPIKPEGTRAQFDWNTRTGQDLGAEEALLLHPVFSDPGEHLEYTVFDKVSVVAPKRLPDGNFSPEGICSIAIYGLNRLALVQARTRVLRHLELLLDISTKAIEARTMLQSEFIDATDKDFSAEELGKLALIEQTLESIDASVRAKFVEMAKPDAEFSAMVAAWIDTL